MWKISSSSFIPLSSLNSRPKIFYSTFMCKEFTFLYAKAIKIWNSWLILSRKNFLIEDLLMALKSSISSANPEALITKDSATNPLFRPEILKGCHYCSKAPLISLSYTKLYCIYRLYKCLGMDIITPFWESICQLLKNSCLTATSRKSWSSRTMILLDGCSNVPTAFTNLNITTWQFSPISSWESLTVPVEKPSSSRKCSTTNSFRLFWQEWVRPRQTSILRESQKSKLWKCVTCFWRSVRSTTLRSRQSKSVSDKFFKQKRSVVNQSKSTLTF